MVLGIAQTGLIGSGALYISHSLTRWLSRFTPLEEPDPTIFMRLFDHIYDLVFTRIGLRAINERRSPLTNSVAFQLSIGIAVILIFPMIQIALSSLAAGTAIAMYLLTGIAVDLTSIYQQILALIVFLSLSVMCYTQEKAQQTIPTT